MRDRQFAAQRHRRWTSLYGVVIAITLVLVLGRPVCGATTVFTNTAGFLMEGVDFDAAGNLYYLERDGAAGTVPTRLIKRTASSGFADRSEIFEYVGSPFGAFVTVQNGRVYFGESSSGSIRSVMLNGSDPTLHAAVPNIYDLVFSPAGDAFISANSESFSGKNQLGALNLLTGDVRIIVSTNDFSGPIEFDADGNLYYGGSGFGESEVFQFTPSQIAAAATGSPIILSSVTPFASTPGNSHFEFVSAKGIFRHASGGLTLLDPVIGLQTPVPGAPGPGLGFFGPIAHDGTSLFGVSTDFANNISTFSQIPEPSAAFLSLLGFLIMTLHPTRRPRHDHRRATTIALGAATLLQAATETAPAGPYPPPAGQAGSPAVAHDDPRILFWADGFVNYQPGPNVILEFMTPGEAIGAAGTGSDPEQEILEVVSLGDGGTITMTFPNPIVDGPGDDFAVFENAFNDMFLEFAYVEVSSNGVDFLRFPNASLTPNPVPFLGGSVDTTDVDGLAGKYRLGFGTPFDLQELGLASASHVRIVDIPGDGSSLDSENRPIYDPDPTDFSGGFDLDAVGVLGLTFGGWQSTHFSPGERSNPAVSGSKADPDHDGLPNDIEYALDSDPKHFTPPSHFATVNLTAGSFSFSMLRSGIAKDAIIHIDVSSNLTFWEEIARATGGGPMTAFGNPGAISVEESISGSRLSTTVTGSMTLDDVTSRFARLRVSSP